MAPPRAKGRSAVYSSACAALYLGTLACVTAGGAVSSDINGPISSRLIGFDAKGVMIVLRESAREHEFRAFALPHGPEQTLFTLRGADPVGAEQLRSLMAEHGWRKADRWQPDPNLTLVPRIEPALGDRRHLDVFARRGETSIPIGRVPISGETEIANIAASPDGYYAIFEIKSAERSSLHTFDVRRARAQLYNLAGLEAYAEGDRHRAAAILERAVEADPRAGDAVYNLACVHALLGDLDRAADELLLAIALDPARYRRLAKQDPDLTPIRSWPRIKEALGHIPEP